MSNKLLSKKVIVRANSWLTAMALVEVSVCQVLTNLFGISSPFIILGVSLIVLSSMINQKIYLKKKVLITYLGLLCILIISWLLNGTYALNYLSTYAVFGLICVVIVPYEIDMIKVLEADSIIIFIRCLVYLLKQRNMVMALNIWDFDKVQMPIAFEFSAAFIISLTLLTLLSKEKHNRKYLAILIPNLIISFIVVFFDCHTRGAIVAVGFGILVIIIQHIKRGRIPAVVIVSLIVLALYSNALPLLNWLSRVMTNRGISLPALDKTIQLISQNNIGNGRSAIFERAINVIQKSPIIGHGVGYFEQITNGGYTHNYFLQVLCEFGFVGLLTSLFFIVPILKIILGSNDDYNSKYIALLFSLSISLLTSGVYWTSFIYIYFMTYFIDKYNFEKKELGEQQLF